MGKADTDEEVRKFLELIPDHGVSVARAAYLYFKAQELDKEFIDKISRLLTPGEEDELNELYTWDLMKEK